jgi:hypothetical protein
MLGKPKPDPTLAETRRTDETSSSVTRLCDADLMAAAISSGLRIRRGLSA